MVLGKLLEVLAAKTVSAAVANVGDGHAFLGKAHGDDGGTHAVLTRMAVRGVINDAIGEPDGASETVGGRTAAGKLVTDEFERGSASASRQCAATESTVRRLATSPAERPPMPSERTNRFISGAARKLSSLLWRTRPGSVSALQTRP